MDLWPALVATPTPLNYSAAHARLWLTTEVMVQGKYKLVVAQQQPIKTNNGPELGWRCGGNGRGDLRGCPAPGGSARSPSIFELRLRAMHRQCRGRRRRALLQSAGSVHPVVGDQKVGAPPRRRRRRRTEQRRKRRAVVLAGTTRQRTTPRGGPSKRLVGLRVDRDGLQH